MHIFHRYGLGDHGIAPGLTGVFLQPGILAAPDIVAKLVGVFCLDLFTAGAVEALAQQYIGKSVAQMVFNTQAIGGGFSGSGGDGWLRLLEFMPDGKTVKATTFSPFFGASPSTFHLAWKEDARNSFTFVID